MAKRKDPKRYAMLVIGIVLIVVSAFVLADANKKQDRCDSLGGKIVQVFDAETEQDCGKIWIYKALAYIGIALGVALTTIGFLRI